MEPLDTIDDCSSGSSSSGRPCLVDKMADQDDTLIDMPLLEAVVDDDCDNDEDDDDDDGDDNENYGNSGDVDSEKGLDELKVLENTDVTVDCGGGDGVGSDVVGGGSGSSGGTDDGGGDGGGDGGEGNGLHKPLVVVCDRNSVTEHSGNTEADDVTCVQGSETKEVQSESLSDSTDDTSSSTSGESNNNNNNLEPNLSLKDEACRLSSTSTPTPSTPLTEHPPTATNDKDDDDASRTTTACDSNCNKEPLTTPAQPVPTDTSQNPTPSSSLSSSTPTLQQEDEQLSTHSGEHIQENSKSLECSSSDHDHSRDQPSSLRPTSTSSTRPGSTSSICSNRLLSSDSDWSCSQDSIVTVEVIAIPGLPVDIADTHAARQQLLAVSGGDDENKNHDCCPNSLVEAEGNGEQPLQQDSQQQHQEEEAEQEVTTSPPSAIGEQEREEEEEAEVTCVETEVVEMSDQQKLEEKLRQFENDAKEREEDRGRNTEDDTVHLSESEKQRRRNLIFDEERFEETFLKCLICREVYNETDKLPKMLHCHHTFCMDCLYQMYRVEGEFRQSLTSVFRNMPLTVKIQCPTCREGIIISEAELRRLPNDHTIMELLCFVNKTGKNDVQYCPKHQMQPLNFFCEPCIMPVCCDCTVLDHKESKGHRVVNVDEAMKKYTPIVEDTLNDIRKEKTTLAGKKEALENTQEDLNRIQSGISDQIRKVFDSIREVLDERERELHDVAVSEVDRKHGVIEGHLNTIADREADLNAEFNSLQLATDDKDISLIFTGHKSARDLLARKVFIPTNSTAGFSITFQFSSRADTVIKQQVANLGDVIFHS